jgi:hypothetical protein
VSRSTREFVVQIGWNAWSWRREETAETRAEFHPAFGRVVRSRLGNEHAIERITVMSR